MGEGELIDILDPEYAMPGELERWPERTPRVEPWPETAKRQIAALEGRVRHLERLVHGLLNQER